MVLSAPAAASKTPFFATATDKTGPAAPANVRSGIGALAFHAFTVLSSPAVIRWPEAAFSTSDRIGIVDAASERVIAMVCTAAVLSALAVTMLAGLAG